MYDDSPLPCLASYNTKLQAATSMMLKSTGLHLSFLQRYGRLNISHSWVHGVNTKCDVASELLIIRLAAAISTEAIG